MCSTNLYLYLSLQKPAQVCVSYILYKHTKRRKSVHNAANPVHCNNTIDPSHCWNNKCLLQYQLILLAKLKCLGVLGILFNI